MNEDENKSDIRRRSILALAGAATAAASGCLDILGLSGDSDDSDGAGSEQSDAPQPNDTAKPQQNQARNQNETQRENDTKSTNETTNETGHQQDANSTEEEEKRQREPTDEETAVNRSKYNETGVRETVARPESDVEIAGASPFTMPDGTVTVSPTITNVSDEAIDFVDLDIYYLDESDREVGHSTDIVRDLGAGEINEFSGSASPADLTGEVDDARVEPFPQDYVSS